MVGLRFTAGVDLNERYRMGKFFDILLAAGVLFKGIWILAWQLLGLGWYLVLFWVLWEMK